MARNPFDDDPDVAAMRSMRPRSGPTSWGRVLFGVLVVVSGTFGFAYYLPLYRAHAALVSDHARLRGELEGVESNLKQTREELKTVSERKDELQAEHEKVEAAAKSQSAGAQSLRDKLLDALDKPEKKKQAMVGLDDAGVRVALASSFLFSTGKIDVSSSGRAALCELAKSSGSATLNVSGVATDDDVPALLKSKLPSAWAYTGAAAASVAETLESKCQVPRGRLRLGSVPGGSAAFAGQSPPSPRVEIVVGTAKKS